MTDGEYLIILLAVAAQLIACALLLRKALTSPDACYSGGLALLVGMFFMSDVFPSLYMLITGILPEESAFFRPYAWSYGQVLSCLYFYCFLAGIFLQPSPPLRLLGRISNRAPRASVFCVLLALFFLSAFGNFFSAAEQRAQGWAAANDFVLREISETSLLRGLTLPFTGLFVLSSVYLLFSLQHVKKGRARFLLSSLGAVGAGLSTLLDVLGGSRGGVMNLATKVFLASWVSMSKRNAIALLAMLLGCLFLLSPLIRAYREAPSVYQGLGTIGQMGAFAKSAKDRPDSSLASSLNEIIFRFDGVPNGGNLALYSDAGHHALFNPFVGVIFAWVPRVLMPSKPHPLSCDGTPQSTPKWLSAAISGRGNMCTSMSTSAIAYWHFGYLGIIIYGALSAYILVTLTALGDTCSRKDLFFLSWFLIKVGEPMDVILLGAMQWLMPILVISVIAAPFVARYSQTKGGSY